MREVNPHVFTENPDLQNTPARFHKAWKEMLDGYQQSPYSHLALFAAVEAQMVLVTDVEFTSVCEHHLLPFQGIAHVGYIPNQHIIGLSKIPRIIDVYAHRMQVQERLTIEIADFLWRGIKPHGLGVLMKAKHGCLACRGARKQTAAMTTSSLYGSFRDELSVRSEFLSLVTLATG